MDVPELTYNADGLIPCIVQDADTLEVLMMAWMNEESLAACARASGRSRLPHGGAQLLLPRDGLGPPRAEALSHIALLDDEACPNLHRNSTICGLMCLNDRGSCANMIEVLNIPPLESHLTSNIPLQACTRALARVSKQIYP